MVDSQDHLLLLEVKGNQTDASYLKKVMHTRRYERNSIRFIFPPYLKCLSIMEKHVLKNDKTSYVYPSLCQLRSFSHFRMSGSPCSIKVSCLFSSMTEIWQSELKSAFWHESLCCHFRNGRIKKGNASNKNLISS